MDGFKREDEGNGKSCVLRVVWEEDAVDLGIGEVGDAAEVSTQESRVDHSVGDGHSCAAAYEHS